MKKAIAKFLALMLLAVGIVFGASFAPSPLQPVVYADEDDGITTPADYPDTNEDTPTEATEDDETDTDNSTTEGNETTDSTDDSEDSEETEETNTCQDQVGALAWIVCPTTGVIATAIDAIYSVINDFLVVNPLSMEDNSPIYLVWQYARNITNIVFIIFLLIVIYSQLTGLGINNYGIKRILPRLIIAVILVNLSFIICSLAVDISNILGAGLRGFFESVQSSVIEAGGASEAANVSLSALLTVLIGGGTVAGVAITAVAGGIGGLFWMLVPILVGGIVAVVTGLITIAARQAIVALLIMISPLAFVAYLLPNTEKWFSKWKDLLFRMLIFYPMFSFLFGASQLAGWALITSASSGFGVILGVAVQILPLFFSWSLMKMSGTILGTLNTGLRKLAAPAQRGLAGWSTSHLEQNRQRYFANSNMPGAHLRQFLDQRKTERDIDTKNSVAIRQGRATEAALKRISSSTGTDADGNDTWRKRAHHYTRNAKLAGIYTTRAENAQSAYKNTLSAYGNHFKGADATRLSDAHSDAYLEAMKQQFLTANEAQADQEWLLSQYMQATVEHDSNPTKFNRLVRGAAGSLGHTGEASIMGQVIVGNSQIEQRRRSEARIIINKFGIKKPQFRAMIFNKAGMNDNGYALDKNGKQIENDQYQLLPGKQYDEWQSYIGVHKKTNEEITKAEYDALSSAERSEYKKIKYFDITDDKDGLIQRVYDDDAGYMKELLTDDIFIGDPINRRYLTEIGVDADDKTKAGILRRYHSTITAAMLASKYKEHAAEVTPMITAQTNMGYVTSIGQYNIANLQSLSVASKAGSINISDGYALDTWAKLLTCTNDELFKKYFPKINLVDGQGNPISAFEYYFPDTDIMDYRNVNGQQLGGLRLQADGTWKELDFDDPSITLEDRKELLKRKILPKAAAKLVSAFNRRMSPNILENQKNDTLKSIDSLLDVLSEIGLKNMDPNTPISEILGMGSNNNIFDSQDPDIAQKKVKETQALIRSMLDAREGGNGTENNDNNSDGIPPSGPHGGNGGGPRSGGPTPSAPASPSHPGVAGAVQRLQRQQRGAAQQAALQDYYDRNNYTNILRSIEDMFADYYMISELYNPLLTYFQNTECLEEFAEDCQILLDDALREEQLDSTMSGISQIVDRDQREQERKAKLYDDIIDLIGRANTYS